MPSKMHKNIKKSRKLKGAVIAKWLKSTSAQNSETNCLKGSYFGQYFTSENIHHHAMTALFKYSGSLA